MYCPQCRTEYREGFDVCADCKIKLVEELPPEPDPEFIEYEQVMQTYNPADIAIIKSILDAEEVTYYFKGDYLALRPIGDAARLMVDRQQVEKVKELIKDLKLSYTEPSI